MQDVPLHLTRNGYIPNLKWIATKYVVLWDEADKRGWLVNGISALLHLVRAFLEHSSRDDFSSSFLFDPSKMNDAVGHKPNSATGVLIDEQNMEMKIYPEKKREYFTFEDLVEQHYNILSQIMEAQRLVAGQNGIKLKLRMRKHLEGWDFRELATGRDPYPRVATLHALAYGWVDFIRSIDAITLLGRGFGNIIQPVEFDGMCPRWKSLPTQKYYLGASIFDLNNIMDDFRHIFDQELLWHCPEDPVSQCQCQRHGALRVMHKAFKRHHDPVQVFYPSWSRLVLRGGIRRPGDLGSLQAGAVVFGHNVAWRYRWNEKGDGDLEEGDPVSLQIFPQNTTELPKQPIPGPSRPRLLSATSGSSESKQSRGTPSAKSTRSAISSRSTPLESIVDTSQSFTPPALELADEHPEPRYGPLPTVNDSRIQPTDDTLRPRYRTLPSEDQSRTLRHDKRRI
jgi:hypothetical protein